MVLRDDDNPESLVPNKDELTEMQDVINKPNLAITKIEEKVKTNIWRLIFIQRKRIIFLLLFDTFLYFLDLDILF